VLYSFTGGNDGGNPDGGVIFDPEGSLFGVNPVVAHELSPNRSTSRETNISSFGILDQSPAISLAIDPNGDLFGTVSARSGSGTNLV